MNILVVDDAPFMRMTLMNLLTQGGHNVVGEAENGLVAIEKYKELKPDLVTMDITMPEMDGVQALKKIREFDPDATVIMVTAVSEQTMMIEAVQNGAKDFVTKPFKASRVYEALNKIKK